MRTTRTRRLLISRIIRSAKKGCLDASQLRRRASCTLLKTHRPLWA
jgi:hypothetical protein